VRHDGVLLLGGTGFIGSALARSLQGQERPVHILGRKDAHQLKPLLTYCDTVIHLASTSTPGSSAARPSLELDNLDFTLHLLELLQKQPTMHLIYFSSGGTVYGNPTRLPVAEDSPLVPLSNHGAGKVAQEVFCQTLRALGHAVTVLRPSNAYGPGQVMTGGFGLVRTMLEHARAGTAMDIWGDGENIRDFIYIDDIVEACLRLIQRPQDSNTYNLGSGVGYSINQVRGIVAEVVGSDVRVNVRPSRGIDVRKVVLDIDRICRELDWLPTVGLIDGVRQTWAWLQKTP
jgi:UDP-glucose 4-epimerase